MNRDSLILVAAVVIFAECAVAFVPAKLIALLKAILSFWCASSLQICDDRVILFFLTHSAVPFVKFVSLLVCWMA
jgi:hypothetical protein